jgi:hypothetical protein
MRRARLWLSAASTYMLIKRRDANPKCVALLSPRWGVLA